MTRWFVLPRFGSNEPSPRWGGHKDRVSFNPFPLSNGHLDRVSFLLNQTGHLDPSQGPPQLGVSCFDYKCLENKNAEEESDPRTRAQRTRAKLSLSLSLVIIWSEWIWDLERLWFYWIVSCIDCTSSCIECEVWKTSILEWWWLGGIYSPNHQMCLVRLLALLWLCANCPHTVHAAGDRWSRPLRFLAIAPLAHRTVRWPTGQSGEL
jgi:hypothetical protein